MRKVVLYIAQSLDGYIATVDHSLDWLFRAEGEGDNGYSEFYQTIDTVLIGRNTYEEILNIENGNFPYVGKTRYVFSSSTDEKLEDIHYISQDVAEFTKKLKREDGGTIWMVGGSELIHALMQEGLIDEFIIQIAPSLIGKGIPLFKTSDIQTDLQLKEVKRYNQIAHLHYKLK